MDTIIALEIIKGIGLAIIISIAFLVVPFGLLILGQMLPWYIMKVYLWSLYIRRKVTLDVLNDIKHDKEVQIGECQPSQVIKRLKSYGLQSLFINYSPTQTPVKEPNALGNEGAPKEFFNSTNPPLIDDKSQHGVGNSPHIRNLLSGDTKCK